MRKTLRIVLGSFFAALVLVALNAPAQSLTLGPGDTYVAIRSGGIKRTFIVHLPPKPDRRPGVILAFHGGTLGTAYRMEQSTKLDALADQNGFLIVYPDTASSHNTWTDGRNATKGGPDDVGFARDIVTYLRRHYGVPSNKVFAAGMSNGGIFTFWLACKAPGLVRAIAPVSANMAQAQQSACSAPQPIPVMMFSGTDDPLMPYDGGLPRLETLIEKYTGPVADTMLSAQDTAALWADVNGCFGPSTWNLAPVLNDGTSVTETDYSNCSTGKAATLYSINGGGHGWPGNGDTGSRLTGLNSNNISADDAMTAFFARFGL